MGILDDETQVRDSDFFAQVRLEYPGLEQVREAVSREDWPEARAAIARYFLHRESPRWYLDWRYLTEPVAEFWDRRYTQANAQMVPFEVRTEALLGNAFVDGRGNRYDIADLSTYPRDRMRHGMPGLDFTRFTWARDLGEMYARTLDGRYAEKLVDILRRFDLAFPRRVTEFDPDTRWLDRSTPPWWHDMDVGKSICTMIIVLYSGALQSRAATPDDVYGFVKKLWFYAAQFTRYTASRTFRNGNHHWHERGKSPFTFGLMFPEFEGFEAMRERGCEVINDHLAQDFFEDGTYTEHSTGYTASTIGTDLLMPWAAAFANDYPLVKPENMDRVRTWMGWMAGMTSPEGSLPPIGDGFPPMSVNLLARAAVLTSDPGLKAAALELTARPDGRYGWMGRSEIGIEPCLRAAWERLEPSTSPCVSVVYPDGGWVALRDSWKPDAMYLAFSAINPPRGRNHGHWDLLHFLVHARGRSFVADPASWIYNGYYTAERRGYLYSSESHNVLTIDDDPLSTKRALNPVWAGEVPRCPLTEWSLGDEVDFVSGYHDGYAPQRHTREAVFVKGRYWLIVDHVSNPDLDWEHTYRRFLHFDFGAEVRQTEGRLVAESNGEALSVLPFALAGQRTRLWRDEYLEQTREQLGEASLPWVAEIKNQMTGPTVMAMLLYPHAGDDVPTLGLSRIEVEGDDGPVPASEAIALEVETPEGRDVWYRSFEAEGEMRFGEHQTDTRAWLHLGAADRSIAIETTVRGDT